MCGRYSDRFTWEELHALYRAFLDPKAPPSTWEPKYNIAPTTQVPVLRFVDGKRRIDLMRWGLVPSWSKEIGKFATFNARSDGCESKPTYRGAWKAGRRCIIPASSFFEWRKADKQAFAISMGNQGPMSFAGLWDEATIEGQSLLSCTMITTEANSIMSPLHDRMPVIVNDNDMPLWLGEEQSTPEALKAMMSNGLPPGTKIWPVSKAVGNVKNQGSHLIDETAV